MADNASIDDPIPSYLSVNRALDFLDGSASPWSIDRKCAAAPDLSRAIAPGFVHVAISSRVADHDATYVVRLSAMLFLPH